MIPHIEQGYMCVRVCVCLVVELLITTGVVVFYTID